MITSVVNGLVAVIPTSPLSTAYYKVFDEKNKLGENFDFPTLKEKFVIGLLGAPPGWRGGCFSFCSCSYWV